MIHLQNLRSSASRYHLVFIAVLVLNAVHVYAKNWTIFLDSTHTTSLDITLDPYYTAVGIGYPLGSQDPVVLDYTEEEGIVGHLLKRIHQPKSGLIETSVNPLPVGGAFMKSHANSWYEQAELSEGFNLVEAVTLGFPDPGALSVFFGNRVYLGDYETGEIKGIGYGGALINMGMHHILRNTMYEDFWAEGEVKVKASTLAKSRDFSTSFRIGTKLHSHPLINHSFFLSIKWDQTDKVYTGWSLTKNANIEFRVDANAHNFYFTRYLALYGKKIPLSEGKYVLSLSLGALRIDPQGYRSWMRNQLEKDQGISLLIQPNLSF